MRNSLKEWCETTDFSIEEIDRRATISFENNVYPTMAYLSMDLYHTLLSSYGHMAKSPGAHAVVSIMTSVGSLSVQPVMRLRNFCMITNHEGFDALRKAGFDPEYLSDQERRKIDQQFEDIVIGDKDEN